MKKILFLLFFYFFSFSLFPHSVFAQDGWADPCVKEVEWCAEKNLLGVCIRTEKATVATIQGFECVMRLILNIVVRLAGIAAFVMILAGGFQYLTSGGNQEGTKKAQGTITWGIAGLAVLILIWFIMKFVKEFTGVDVTQFTIPGP